MITSKIIPINESQLFNAVSFVKCKTLVNNLR